MNELLDMGGYAIFVWSHMVFFSFPYYIFFNQYIKFKETRKNF